MRLLVAHCAGPRAVCSRAVLPTLQELFAEALCVLVGDCEARAAEVCHALRKFDSAGVAAAATIVLLVAFCGVRPLRSTHV